MNLVNLLGNEPVFAGLEVVNSAATLLFAANRFNDSQKLRREAVFLATTVIMAFWEVHEIDAVSEIIFM